MHHPLEEIKKKSITFSQKEVYLTFQTNCKQTRKYTAKSLLLSPFHNTILAYEVRNLVHVYGYLYYSCLLKVGWTTFNST